MRFSVALLATSARLPIRTLASEYALAAVLRNQFSVSLGDLDGSPKYIASDGPLFGYLGFPDRPSACPVASDKKGQEADFPCLIYYWVILFGTERGMGRV